MATQRILGYANMIPGDRVTVVFVEDTPVCDAAEPLFFRISLQPLNGLNSNLVFRVAVGRGYTVHFVLCRLKLCGLRYLWCRIQESWTPVSYITFTDKRI